MIQDSKALAHVVKNGYDYPKNNIVRGEMGRALGHGLLYVEGESTGLLALAPSAKCRTGFRRQS